MTTRVLSRVAASMARTVPGEMTMRPAGWWALGGGRIIIGVLWFQQLLWKLPPTFGAPAGLMQWMQREAAHPLIPLYGAFVKTVALPHFHLFGWLTFFIESAIALSLLLGLFTRLGGLVGALWALNLAVGLWAVPGEWYWTYLMLALLNAIFAATAAGRYIGLDALIRRLSSRGLARVVDLVS